MSRRHLTQEEAVEYFVNKTGMTREGMDRAGITMQRCNCGSDLCNGWIAVGAWLEADGTPRPIR